MFDDEEDDQMENKGQIIEEEEINSQTSLKDFDEIEKIENLNKNEKNQKNEEFLNLGKGDKIGLKRKVSIIDSGSDRKIDDERKKSFYEKRKTSEILEYSKVKQMMKDIVIEEEGN